MNCSCDESRELMAAAWRRELDASGAAQLEDHLANCADCADEMASLGAIWEKLGDLPVPEPSAGMRRRFEQTMRSLETPRYVPVQVRSPWWRAIWPENPAWQMAIAGLCLAIGLGVGAYLQRGAGERDEVAELRKEVASTKEMVAVSLLQEQSAAERLRGVDYSARMPSMEPQVIAALVQAVNRDSNVNVRLAAIDALGKVAGDATVRASMQEALPQQDSPMVQAALIDYLVQAHDRSAVNTIQDLVSRPGVNPTVHDRGIYAVRQLAQ